MEAGKLGASHGLAEIEHWLEPYRQLWAVHLDALEDHLDIADALHDFDFLLDQVARGFAVVAADYVITSFLI